LGSGNEAKTVALLVSKLVNKVGSDVADTWAWGMKGMNTGEVKCEGAYAT
jgi:hypothetical protein